MWKANITNMKLLSLPSHQNEARDKFTINWKITFLYNLHNVCFKRKPAFINIKQLKITPISYGLRFELLFHFTNRLCLTTTATQVSTSQLFELAYFHLSLTRVLFSSQQVSFCWRMWFELILGAQGEAQSVRERTGALQQPDVTGAGGTGCTGRSGLSCPGGAALPLGRADQSAAFPLPAKYQPSAGNFRASMSFYFSLKF